VTTSKKAKMTAAITFKGCAIEAKPRQQWVNETIMAVEGQLTVDKLFENSFGQVLAIGNDALRGMTFESYEDAAKAIGVEIVKLQKDVFEELDIRAKDIEAKHTGPEKVERLERVGQIREKMKNSLKSAKSVITNAVRGGEQILGVVKDGGHILWRSDGTPRGKTQLQDLIKESKSAARTPKSDLEKAMDAGITFARRLSVLESVSREDVLRMFNTRLDDLVRDEWGDEEDEEPNPVKAAA